MYKVYVKAYANGCIYAVESSAFLSDPTGWTEIDEGNGERYQFAQTLYFGEDIAKDGTLAQALREDWEQMPLGQRTRARTDEEIAADRAALPAPDPTDTDILNTLLGVSENE